MKFLRYGALFAAGGTGYVGLEILWRGRSHCSMFLAGGVCFLLLGRLSKRSLPVQAVCSTGVITTVELITGLIANRSYHVWDYRDMPANFLGQICLVYSLLWIPVGMGAIYLYNILDNFLKN